VHAPIPSSVVFVPAGHVSQLVFLYPEANFPIGQSLTALLPVVSVYVPGDVAMHDVEAVEPANGLYVPIGHSWHASAAVEPVFGLNVPGGQETRLVLPYSQ
jgi:hypothetical protein